MTRKRVFLIYGALAGVALSVWGYLNDPYIEAGVAPYGYIMGVAMTWPIVGWIVGYIAGSVRDKWASEAETRDK